MPRAIVFSSILFLTVLVLVGAGCGGRTGEAPGTTPSVAEVVEKAKSLGGYQFEATLEQTGQSVVNFEMWVKGDKMRWKGSPEGQEMVYYMDMAERSAIIYMPAQNMAMRQNFGEIKQTVGDSPHKTSTGLLDREPENLGLVAWDGETCLLVKVTADNDDVTRWWLWVEHGIPIKTETTSQDGKSIITEFHNIEMGDIPDSEFELPAGVQVMEYPSF